MRREDFASAEGNCRESSSEGNAFRGTFILMEQKKVESNEIACGIHHRIAEGGLEEAAGN